YRSNETSRRLHYIPGVGPLLATALVANVADPRAFRSGRNFSAWIGLVPKQHSSGARTGSAGSANQVIRIYPARVVAARPRSSAMRRPTAANMDHGSWHCWRGDQPRLRRSRLLINSPEWPRP